MTTNHDFEDIPEFDRVMRGLVEVNPNELPEQFEKILRESDKWLESALKAWLQIDWDPEFEVALEPAMKAAEVSNHPLDIQWGIVTSTGKLDGPLRAGDFALSVDNGGGYDIVFIRRV
jgi:hypothetical protein